MKKIIIADDHAIVREGIKMLLSGNPEYSVVEEAETGTSFLEKIKTGVFDLIILDIGLPDMDVFDILYSLKQNKINIPILIFTMNPEKFYARRLLKYGVKGYISKSSSPENILEAIKITSRNEIYISLELARQIATDISHKHNESLHEILTDREFQIMKAIAAGLQLTDIADKFFISKATVSNHRTNILNKLKLDNNFEIIQYAIDNKIV